MRTTILALAALVSCAARPAFAQLASHPDAPIRIGHYHLNVTSVEAHKKFWADTLGGRAMKFGGIDVIEFPDEPGCVLQGARSEGHKGHSALQ
jgi:hypothetical protein